MWSWCPGIGTQSCLTESLAASARWTTHVPCLEPLPGHGDGLCFQGESTGPARGCRPSPCTPNSPSGCPQRIVNAPSTRLDSLKMEETFPVEGRSIHSRLSGLSQSLSQSVPSGRWSSVLKRPHLTTRLSYTEREVAGGNLGNWNSLEPWLPHATC